MRSILARFTLPELGAQTSSNGGLHDWLLRSRFTDIKKDDRGFILRAYSDIELYSAFTPDYQRFAFSSFESFHHAELEKAKHSSMGWPLLKLYYSAFFAAHAITRATGSGQINLSRQVIKPINEFLELTSKGFDIPSGPYTAEIEESNNDICLILKSTTKGSGVHDSFWKFFCSQMDLLAKKAVVESLPNATEFIGEVEALNSCILSNDGSTAWFSDIRNEINYKHGHDCWLPLTKKAKAKQIEIPKHLEDPDTLEIDLRERNCSIQRMANLSKYLASTNYFLILNLVSQLSGSTTFVRQWKRLKTAID